MIDLRNGDCLEVLKNIEDNSVDLILTDPPYELNFMNKGWDNTGIAFNTEMWKEAYRVLKPGSYLMAFSGTRTYHRMAVAIEDAGFEIKDMIEWVYGSGFPKALDISKAIDKKLGKEREVVGIKTTPDGKPYSMRQTRETWGHFENKEYGTRKINHNITAPATDIAKQYEGYKTQLKPAHEPICLAMKPLSEKNFAENVMKWGTGGLNIDGTRIGYEDTPNPATNPLYRAQNGYKIPEKGQESKGAVKFTSSKNEINSEGRYTANFIISEDIAPVLDKQSKEASRYFYNAKIEEEDYIPFCYTAKCSKKERNSDIKGQVHNNMNNHATVKPKSILTYLLKLGLPPIHNAIVLDMFAGSGSTGIALEMLNKETGSNHKCILIEKEEEYAEIIKKRCCL